MAEWLDNLVTDPQFKELPSADKARALDGVLAKHDPDYAQLGETERQQAVSGIMEKKQLASAEPTSIAETGDTLAVKGEVKGTHPYLASGVRVAAPWVGRLGAGALATAALQPELVPAAAMLGGPVASMAAEPLAQWLEGGVREHPIREGAVQAALGAIPGIPGGGLMRGALSGAAQGVAADVALRAARGESQSLTGTGLMAGVGGAFGTAGSLAERALTSGTAERVAGKVGDWIESTIPPRARVAVRPQDVPISEVGQSIGVAGEALKAKGMQEPPVMPGLSDVWESTKDIASRASASIGQAARQSWDWYNAPPRFDSFDAILGARNKGINDSGVTMMQFQKDVRPLSREWRRAVNAWVAERGDKTALEKALQDNWNNPSLRRKYQNALTLPPEMEKLAGDVRNYFDQMIDQNAQAGILHATLEDYLHRIWRRRPPTDTERRLWSTATNAPLSPNPSYMKSRALRDMSEAEAERLGYRSNDDIAWRIAHYQAAFDQAAIDRATIHNMFEKTASDGRPIAAIRGSGSMLGPTSKNEAPTFMVSPHARPDTIQDYVTETQMKMDVPQLRNWKWIGKTDDGTSVLHHGDAVIHPEFANRFASAFGRSRVSNPVVRTLMRYSSEYKQTLFSLSRFHETTEELHAWAHGVPFRELLSPPDIPWGTRDMDLLLNGGLTLANPRAQQRFSEGVAGGGLIRRIPGIGQLQEDYNAYLFQSKIPRLKARMALMALERNRRRYGATLSEEQIARQTAKQADFAFGEINWAMLGTSKTTQDVMRLMFTAPDFNVARIGFMGQGLLPYNAEQRTALLRIALGNYVTARIINKAANGNYHWDIPFGYKVEDVVYTPRTIAGDEWHLVSDPRSYLYNRLNPAVVMPEVKLMFGDVRGRKYTASDVLWDTISGITPISGKGMLQRLGLQEGDQTIFEGILSAAGVSAYPYRTPTERQIIKARSMTPGTPESSEGRAARMAQQRAIEAKRDGEEPRPGDWAMLSETQKRRVVRLGTMERFEALLDGLPLTKLLDAYETSRGFGNEQQTRTIRNTIAKRFTTEGKSPMAAVKPAEMANVDRMMKMVTEDMKADQSKLEREPTFDAVTH